MMTSVSPEHSTRPPQGRALFSPVVDFFLLGAASLFIFPLVMMVFPTEAFLLKNVSPAVITTVLLLAYVVNYPHFAYSYQLLYSHFSKKILKTHEEKLYRRYIFVGIIVPMVMVGVFVYVYLQQDIRLLQYAVNAMLLTAGWHYAKQGFGALIVISVYARVFYTPLERKLLLANAHLLWLYAWVMFNTGSVEKVYQGIHFVTLGFPQLIETMFFVLVTATSLATMIALIKKYVTHRVAPPLNGIGAYMASSYLWVILRFGQGYDTPIHPIVIFIPFLHSLQYVSMVIRMKMNETSAQKRSAKSLINFTFWGVVIGFLIFETIPLALDNVIHYDKVIFGPTWFVFMFWIFINIHHYFIDNAIWRRENSQVQKYLFNPC